jgi:hypothetical protein
MVLVEDEFEFEWVFWWRRNERGHDRGRMTRTLLHRPCPRGRRRSSGGEETSANPIAGE